MKVINKVTDEDIKRLLREPETENEPEEYVLHLMTGESFKEHLESYKY